MSMRSAHLFSGPFAFFDAAAAVEPDDETVSTFSEAFLSLPVEFSTRLSAVPFLILLLAELEATLVRSSISLFFL